MTLDLLKEKTSSMFEKPPKTLTGNPALVYSGFDELPHNPLHLLQNWFKEAIKFNVSEPGSLVLSTVDMNRKPSSRVVLLKTVDDTGVIFSSSSNSKKGIDISNNTSVAGTLWWRETMQQVNFMGHASKMLPSISDDIWSGRTPEAQAVAAISDQSAIMSDEELMRESIKDLINSKTNIPRPETWHAYHITIQDIEFWLGSRDRFHHRVQYKIDNGIWYHQKLQP